MVDEVVLYSLPPVAPATRPLPGPMCTRDLCSIFCFPLLLSTSLSLPTEVCDSPDQGAHYHILRLGPGTCLGRRARGEEASRLQCHAVADVWAQELVDREVVALTALLLLPPAHSSPCRV